MGCAGMTFVIKEVALAHGRAYAPEPGVVVVETNPGVHITTADSVKAWEAYRELHGGPYVLVVNRVHTYSLDLTLWHKLSDDPWLQAVVVVAYRPLTRTTAEQLERRFVRKPMHVAHSLDQALDLARPHLKT